MRALAVPAVTPVRRRPRVLVTEDDPDMRRWLERHLQRAGFETMHAETGVVAVQHVELHAPDALLLDLGLPSGDGFFVLEQLADPLWGGLSIPVLVVTGHERHEAQRALDAGADGAFTKPVDPVRLIDRLRKLLADEVS